MSGAACLSSTAAAAACKAETSIPPRSLRIERALVLSQDSAPYKALAEEFELAGGICGYVACATSANASKIARPTTRAGVAELVAELQRTALPPLASEFSAWAAPIRERRLAYVASGEHDAEFTAKAPTVSSEKRVALCCAKHAGCKAIFVRNSDDADVVAASAVAAAAVLAPMLAPLEASGSVSLPARVVKDWCPVGSFLHGMLSVGEISHMVAANPELASSTFVRPIQCKPHGCGVAFAEPEADVLKDVGSFLDGSLLLATVMEEAPLRAAVCDNSSDTGHETQPCCWFVEQHPSRGVRLSSLAAHANAGAWLDSSHCCPYIIDTPGHYISAIPLCLEDGEKEEMCLLVLESLETSMDEASNPSPPVVRALARALAAGANMRAHADGALKA